ncbi:MAG: hypothetical protein JW909_09300 [Planctomycetes bacterium]|nr:hypothetical protein [Planctomycetota bacterium]
MKKLLLPAAALACLAAAVAAQVGVVSSRGMLGIANPIYRKHADQVSRAEYVTSFGMYLPKGDFAFAASAFLGGLRADAYWLKAAQYVSKSFEDPALKTRFLGDLYIAMIRIDPWWSSAAVTASNAVTGVTNDNEQAVEILDRAIRVRPDDWRLWYARMAVYLFWPGHKSDAVRSALIGASRPGASRALLDAANQLALEDGHYELAVRVARRRIKQYGLDSALGRIAWRDYLEHYSRYLEHLLAKDLEAYRQKHGNFPASLDGLVADGILKDLPPEPYGLGWIYDPASGAVLSRGLGTLEGARMHFILSFCVTRYYRRHGIPPASIQAALDDVKFTAKDIEPVRYFGNPPSLVPHPVLGDWKYDPATGRIELGPGMDIPHIFRRADELRERLLSGGKPL